MQGHKANSEDEIDLFVCSRTENEHVIHRK